MTIKRKFSLLIMAFLSFFSLIALNSCFWNSLEKHEEDFLEALKLNVIPESAHPETVEIKNFKESYLDGAIVFFYLEGKNINDKWQSISLVLVTEDITLADYTKIEAPYYAASVEKGFYCINFEVDNWYDTEDERKMKLSALSLLTENGLTEKDSIEYNVEKINKALKKYQEKTYK